jgi:hypothetical protein
MRSSASPSHARTARQVVAHPILFALYPAVFLYSANWKVFDASIVVVPIALALLLTSTVWFVLNRVCGDIKQSGLLTSAVVLSLFSYRAVAEFLQKLSLEADSTAIPVGSQVIFLSVVVVIGCAVGWFKLKRYSDQLTYIVNIVGMVLVFVPIAEICVRSYETTTARQLVPQRQKLAAAPETLAQSQRPDIYYMVLDGYGRSDYLAQHYGLDNSDFTGFLEEKGFYVASQSTTNYPITLVSIASTLNSMYWDDLGEQLGEFSDRRFMREMMQRSRVVGALRSAGYRIVAFDTEYSEAGIGGADVVVREWWYPNAFQIAWLQMTPLPDMLETLGYPVLYDLHRRRVADPLDKLPEVAKLAGPKFVYFHTFFAHPPFVFGPHGERVSSASTYSWDDGDKFMNGASGDRDQYINGYRQQVLYLNEKLKTRLEELLAQYEQPPIIIIQGDHGPGSRFSLTSLDQTDIPERYSIMNAFLLPDKGRQLLYDSISPVNTFRIVMNTCCGTNYAPLEDKSYYNPFLQPYNYTAVNESQKQVQGKPFPDNSGEINAALHDIGQ